MLRLLAIFCRHLQQPPLLWALIITSPTRANGRDKSASRRTHVTRIRFATAPAPRSRSPGTHLQTVTGCPIQKDPTGATLCNHRFCSLGKYLARAWASSRNSRHIPASVPWSDGPIGLPLPGPRCATCLSFLMDLRGFSGKRGVVQQTPERAPEKSRLRSTAMIHFGCKF